jgi:hypothetical protein
MTGPLHPDLDALSAALDGEDLDAAAHAASCPTCGPQLARLASVRDLVASEPAPLPDVVVDRVVSAAVRASTVTPFSEARRRAPRRPPLRSAAVAAAAIAVLAALPVLFSALGGRTNDMAVTSGEGANTEALADADADAGAGDASGAVVAEGAAAGGSAASSDLGDQTDPDALARVVAAALPQPGAPAAAAATRGSGESGGGQAAASSPPVPTTCEAQARGIGAGRLGRLVYSAAARWRGEPAEVLAFELLPGDGVRAGERQLYVLSRPDCVLRAEKRF